PEALTSHHKLPRTGLLPKGSRNHSPFSPARFLLEIVPCYHNTLPLRNKPTPKSHRSASASTPHVTATTPLFCARISHPSPANSSSSNPPPAMLSTSTAGSLCGLAEAGRGDFR